MRKRLNREWLIWSFEHNAWWKPNEMGYTESRDSAGRYTIERATKIVEQANKYSDTPNEKMIKANDITL